MGVSCGSGRWPVLSSPRPTRVRRAETMDGTGLDAVIAAMNPLPAQYRIACAALSFAARCARSRFFLPLRGGGRWRIDLGFAASAPVQRRDTGGRHGERQDDAPHRDGRGVEHSGAHGRDPGADEKHLGRPRSEAAAPLGGAGQPALQWPHRRWAAAGDHGCGRRIDAPVVADLARRADVRCRHGGAVRGAGQ